jgi:hypothetical protein
MLDTRVLDKTGKLMWHGVLPNRLPNIKVELLSSKLEAVFERELGEEDGGPLLIYRLTKETIQDGI